MLFKYLLSVWTLEQNAFTYLFYVLCPVYWSIRRIILSFMSFESHNLENNRCFMLFFSYLCTLTVYN